MSKPVAAKQIQKAVRSHLSLLLTVRAGHQRSLARMREQLSAVAAELQLERGAKEQRERRDKALARFRDTAWAVVREARNRKSATSQNLGDALFAGATRKLEVSTLKASLHSTQRDLLRVERERNDLALQLQLLSAIPRPSPEVEGPEIAVAPVQLSSTLPGDGRMHLRTVRQLRVRPESNASPRSSILDGAKERDAKLA